MRFIKEVMIFLCGFFICAIVMKFLSSEQTIPFLFRFLKSVGLLMVGATFGVVVMACLSAAKYDDIHSGRIDG